ncbi:MAG: transglutaminase TgpA family protein [Verrucomicrobiales bacterium]
MISARNKFILAGFLAQALTWNSLLPMLLWPSLWIFCLALRGRVKLGLYGEAAALFIGGVVSYWAGKTFNNSAHFFLGDALIFLQLSRLLRELNYREKLISLFIACFHLAVLCTLAPNIRFIPLFLATVWLLPKSMMELVCEKENETGEKSPRLAGWNYAALLASAVIAFTSLPRLFAGAPIQLHGESGDAGSFFDTVLDSSRGGQSNSDAVLLQIEAGDLGYLRCLALTQFDGINWSANKRDPLQRIDFVSEDKLSSYRKRKVRVKQVRYLGNVLPSDGKVIGLSGRFFFKPMETANGIIQVQGSWNTANNIYEYWIDPSPAPEPLFPSHRHQLLQYPRQSPRLHEWIDSITQGSTNLLGAARQLEAYLGTNFVYKIGAPGLDRLNPIDDFIFNAREGHCERFASAMALFLRMQGVPSRLVIGYAPSLVTGMEGWRQVRFRDAHAWAEGYFEGVGWVQFDATPGPGGDEGGSAWRDILEAIDFIWYSRVVNFDSGVQKELLSSVFQKLSSLPAMSLERLGSSMFTLSVVAAIIVLLWTMKNRLQPGKRTTLKAPPPASLVYYREMLEALRRQGFSKDASETPFEFAGRIQGAGHPAAMHVQQITQIFCDEVYGLIPPESPKVFEVKQALKQVEKAG